MTETRVAGFADSAFLLRCVSNEALHLIVMPTEACNFRCVYCYEDFRYKQMEPWVVRGIKTLLGRRAPGLRELSISWFGGEPLLASNVIEEVMTHVQGLAGAHPALRVSSDATTNAYLLTPVLANRLLDRGVSRYQISFDGPREWHDRKRVLAGGKGTFDRIWGNLIALRGLARKFTITIRVHVDRNNVEAMREFIDGCGDAFAADPRFELFVRGLSRLGGANDAELAVFAPGEGEAVFQELRSYARSRGLRTMQFSQSDSVCYAARGNSYVVRANGRLNKCTIALEHPNNQVGHIREDGTVDVDSQKMAGWMRGVWSGDPAALKCPMKGHADPERRRPEGAIPLIMVPPSPVVN
jgi:uncharacterized protein